MLGSLPAAATASASKLLTIPADESGSAAHNLAREAEGATLWEGLEGNAPNAACEANKVRKSTTLCGQAEDAADTTALGGAAAVEPTAASECKVRESKEAAGLSENKPLNSD